MLLVAGLSYSCVQDGQDAETSGLQKPQLSIEEARAFYDQGLLQQQTRATAPRGLFSVGAVESNWSSAEMSAVNAISCVDVPTKTEFVYFISRVNAQKETWSVRAWSKLTVVKSVETGIIASYMHFFVPETEYAKIYDCDVSDFFANCQDRYDYSGLEFYTTLDGFPVAAAKYVNGKLCASAFLSDKKQSYDVNLRALAQLLCNLGIQKTDWQSAAKVSSVRKGDWDPMGRTLIIEDTGHILIVIDEGNGDYSLTPTFKYIDKDKDIDIDGGGGGGGSGSPGGNGMGDGLSPFPDIPSILPPGGGSGGGSGSGGGIGGGGSGGGSGPGGSGDGGGSGGGTGGGTGGSGSGGGVSVGGGISGIQVWRPNPIPWNPPPPDIPPVPLPQKPCFDLVAGEANPLEDMKISDDNKSWKSNTWGYVRVDDKFRPVFHDGLDLLGKAGVTPVYSMYDGEVVQVIYGQPNRISRDKYPVIYENTNKDKNGAGNRIKIKTTLPNGEVIYVSYWHLDVTGKNPYTQAFKEGDMVKRGQKIGVVGNTGNAYRKKAHLHLHCKIASTENRYDAKNNPFLYVYTKFDPKTGVIIRDC